MRLKKARGCKFVVPEKNYNVSHLNYLKNEQHHKYQCVSKHSPVGLIVYRTCLSEIWRSLSVRHNNKLLQNMDAIRHQV